MESSTAVGLVIIEVHVEIGDLMPGSGVAALVGVKLLVGITGWTECSGFWVGLPMCTEYATELNNDVPVKLLVDGV